MDHSERYLGIEALRELAGLLGCIPRLAEDLEDAVIGRARSHAMSTRRRSRTGDQLLPFDVEAAEVRDNLRASLAGWVRLVCEQRGLAYSGPRSTAGLARWLRRNLIAVAMTRGVESAPADIRSVVVAAERVMCPPPRRLTLDATSIEAVRRLRLNTFGIITLAKEMGGPFRTVTVRRLQTLRDAGKVVPVPGPWAPSWPEQFVVGEVLDAHLAHPARRRKTEM
ncbi:hypothetical protein ACFXO9_07300 [Nocardia tengchongensis]|uniref:hypothetical protein n=1 Tax=Nocardia tengchongensis TaxID=2055889 RepID=UPI00367AA5C9